MQPYVVVKEKVYRSKLKTRMKVFSLTKAIKKTKVCVSTFVNVQNQRVHTVFRSLKSRVVITCKTLKAMFQLFQFLEKLIKETEETKEEIITTKVMTAQLFKSFNYLYGKIHEISKETGIAVPELDMDALPTRATLGL